MITSFLLTILFDLILIPLLPLTALDDVVIPPDLANAIQNVQGFISSVDPIFPVATLIIILGIVVLIEVAIFTYKGIMWVIKKIPTIS